MDYSTMWPTIVVLDTAGVMRRFRDLVECSGKPRLLPDDMAHQIIYSFRKRERAEVRLDDFLTKVAHHDSDDTMYGTMIDGHIARLTLELGEVIFAQLIHHCLYDEFGILPYEHILPREPRFNNVILRRYKRGNYGKPMSNSPVSTMGGARYR